MATGGGKAQCITCKKEKSTVRCNGCLKEFCYDHWPHHRQYLNEQLDELVTNRDLLQQELIEQRRKITEGRPLLSPQHKVERLRQIDVNLTELTDRLRTTRQENDFNEFDIHQLKQNLIELAGVLSREADDSLERTSTTLNDIMSGLESSGK